MQHTLIITRLKYKKDAKGLTLRNIQELTGVNYNTARRILRGHDSTLYNLLDLIDGMGLEIRQEGTTEVLNHDSLITLLQEVKGDHGMQLKEIARRTGIDRNTIGRLFRGENVSLTVFFKTLEAMGVELTII